MYEQKVMIFCCRVLLSSEAIAWSGKVLVEILSVILAFLSKCNEPLKIFAFIGDLYSLAGSAMVMILQLHRVPSIREYNNSRSEW